LPKKRRRKRSNSHLQMIATAQVGKKTTDLIQDTFRGLQSHFHSNRLERGVEFAMGEATAGWTTLVRKRSPNDHGVRNVLVTRSRNGQGRRMLQKSTKKVAGRVQASGPILPKRLVREARRQIPTV
jgi:hypothetical protein